MQRSRFFSAMFAFAAIASSCSDMDMMPNQPSDLKVIELTGGGHVSWKDNSDNEAQFMVERKVGAGEFAVLATLPFNSTEFHDAPLMVGVTYVYRVMAMGKEGGHEGKNEYSNEAALTLAAGTAAPAGGAAGNGTGGPSAGRAHRGGGTAGHM